MAGDQDNAPAVHQCDGVSRATRLRCSAVATHTVEAAEIGGRVYACVEHVASEATLPWEPLSPAQPAPEIDLDAAVREIEAALSAAPDEQWEWGPGTHCIFHADESDDSAVADVLGPMYDVNGPLIVAMRNHAPALVAALRQAQREAAEARARYQKRHAQTIEALDNGDRFADERDAMAAAFKQAERDLADARAKLAALTAPVEVESAHTLVERWRRNESSDVDMIVDIDARDAQHAAKLAEAEGSARSCAEGAHKHGRRAKTAERERDAMLAVVNAVHGADIPPSRLTKERIDAALARAREGTQDLEQSLREVFDVG